MFRFRYKSAKILAVAKGKSKRFFFLYVSFQKKKQLVFVFNGKITSNNYKIAIFILMLEQMISYFSCNTK